MVKLISALLSLTMLFGTGTAHKSTQVTANVPITVGKQQAVYEQYNADLDVCLQCGGTGLIEESTAPLVPCGDLCSCRQMVLCRLHIGGGDGCGTLAKCRNDRKHPNIKVECTTCSGSGLNGYKKGLYLQDIQANSGSLPMDGRHSDGFWYVFKKLIQE